MADPIVPPDLTAVFRAEAQVDREIEKLEREKRSLDDVVVAATEHMPCDVVGQVRLRLRLGRAATIEERQTEAARLRKLRQRVNRRHALLAGLLVSSGNFR